MTRNGKKDVDFSIRTLGETISKIEAHFTKKNNLKTKSKFHIGKVLKQILIQFLTALFPIDLIFFEPLG